jgi:hypothetical protein
VRTLLAGDGRPERSIDLGGAGAVGPWPEPAVLACDAVE